MALQGRREREERQDKSASPPFGRRSTFAIFQTAAAKKTLKSHALDASADGAQLFLNAAISALDVPAGVVHQRFAFGAEPGQNQRRARAQVGGANRRAGQIRRTLHDGMKRFSKIVSRNTLVPGVLQATAIIGACKSVGKPG